VGDGLDGPPNLVHGGFSAALLDDLFAWCAFKEREARGLPQNTMILTANLNVSYKRPVPNDSAYYIEVEAERLEKSKKLFLKATLYDSKDRPCVEATSLYVLKAPAPKK
jgi:thioesterase superfamily protein 4